MLPKNPPELQDVDLPSQQFMLGPNQTRIVRVRHRSEVYKEKK